jgi:hypothetical protein
LYFVNYTRDYSEVEIINDRKIPCEEIRCLHVTLIPGLQIKPTRGAMTAVDEEEVAEKTLEERIKAGPRVNYLL